MYSLIYLMNDYQNLAGRNLRARVMVQLIGTVNPG